MKIGVFDSGVGGEAVAEELRRLIPNAMVISINDHANVPYGNRPRYEIIKLTRAAIKPLVDIGCDAIVIACNTATTNAIQLLRQEFPNQKFVGIEPMVKTASSLTKTGKIAVLATPATLKSNRYNALKEEWASDLEVYEPDCSSWAELIEAGRVDEIDLKETVQPLIECGVDVFVLGCTHYHLFKEALIEIVGEEVAILEPSNAIKNRIVDITSPLPRN